MASVLGVLANIFTLTFLRGPKTRLFWAIIYRALRTVMRLTEKYPELTNARDSNGMTPLQLAAFFSSRPRSWRVLP